MENISRRSLLRLSGYLTGGLVLPFAGTKALALINPADAEAIAVRPTTMPVSNDLLQFRSLTREYIRIRHDTWEDWHTGARSWESQQAAVDESITPAVRHYEAAAMAIVARPVTSWADIGELAEIAWAVAPKDMCPVRERSGELQRGYWRRRDPSNPYVWDHHDDLRLSAQAALIEGVLAMTGGHRFDMGRGIDALTAEERGHRRKSSRWS